jgi:hypothetical protein
VVEGIPCSVLGDGTDYCLALLGTYLAPLGPTYFLMNYFTLHGNFPVTKIDLTKVAVAIFAKSP